MKTKEFIRNVGSWLKMNIVAVSLVICFIIIYIVSEITGKVIDNLGSTSIGFLNSEYYRWFTCIFLHFDILHILANSVALLAIGSIISSFIGKWKSLLIFVVGGVLAEIAFSYIMSFSEPIYGGGSSGGIFSLIACFVVCYLRFPHKFNLKWYRLDVIIVIVYFIFANTNMTSFLTHSFAFVVGIIISFIMVLLGLIKNKDQTELK